MLCNKGIGRQINHLTQSGQATTQRGLNIAS